MKKLSTGKREKLIKELDESLLAHIAIAMGEVGAGNGRRAADEEPGSKFCFVSDRSFFTKNQKISIFHT